jgi:hypothetical protein
MRKSFLLGIGLALAILPSAALGHVSVIQDGCRQGNGTVTVLFSVVNFDVVPAICDLHFLPENPVPGCIMIGCSVPAGWHCALNPTGGADWQADAAADNCIHAGQIKHGFDFVLDPEFCCYLVTFTGPNGETLAQQEECFDCLKVGTQNSTWGNVKDMFK